MITAPWWWVRPSGTLERWRHWLGVIFWPFLLGYLENWARITVLYLPPSLLRKVSIISFSEEIKRMSGRKNIVCLCVCIHSEGLWSGEGSPGWEDLPLATQRGPHGSGEALGRHPEICRRCSEAWGHDQGVPGAESSNVFIGHCNCV